MENQAFSFALKIGLNESAFFQLLIYFTIFILNKQEVIKRIRMQ